MSEGDEREFLHDLASPVGTAMFALDSLMESFQRRGKGVTREELDQAGQIHAALEKVAKLIRDRREVLIRKGVPSATEK